MRTQKELKEIIKTIPKIRAIINKGGKWPELQALCEPLGLNDTAFRENPTTQDFLMDITYWQDQLENYSIIELRSLAGRLFNYFHHEMTSDVKLTRKDIETLSDLFKQALLINLI